MGFGRPVGDGLGHGVGSCPDDVGCGGTSRLLGGRRRAARGRRSDPSACSAGGSGRVCFGARRSASVASRVVAWQRSTGGFAFGTDVVAHRRLRFAALRPTPGVAVADLEPQRPSGLRTRRTSRNTATKDCNPLFGGFLQSDLLVVAVGSRTWQHRSRWTAVPGTGVGRSRTLEASLRP